MNINTLFKEQENLDNHIKESKGVDPSNQTNKKVVALIVELGEMMNELPQLFKYWSNKQNKMDKALEEYIDVLHFALSIANDLGYSEHEYADPGYYDLNSLTIGLTNVITLIPMSNNNNHMRLFIDYLIKLGYQLGFTEETVIQAYYDKNKTNYKRQETGY